MSSTPPGPEIWANIDRRLRTGDEDRWLSSRYAPLPARHHLVAFYGFCWELARVRLIVTEPALGAIRFQWWRDALDELAAGQPPRAHDVVAAVAELLEKTDVTAEKLQSVVDAYENAFEDGDRSLEPEAQIASLAVQIVHPETSANEVIATLAPVFAARRRGEAVTESPAPHRVEPTIRPALAHFRLRKLYRRAVPPGPLAKRLCVLRAVMSGRI